MSVESLHKLQLTTTSNADSGSQRVGAPGLDIPFGTRSCFLLWDRNTCFRPLTESQRPKIVICYESHFFLFYSLAFGLCTLYVIQIFKVERTRMKSFLESSNCRTCPLQTSECGTNRKYALVRSSRYKSNKRGIEWLKSRIQRSFLKSRTRQRFLGGNPQLNPIKRCASDIYFSPVNEKYWQFNLKSAVGLNEGKNTPK